MKNLILFIFFLITNFIFGQNNIGHLPILDGSSYNEDRESLLLDNGSNRLISIYVDNGLFIAYSNDNGISWFDRREITASSDIKDIQALKLSNNVILVTYFSGTAFYSTTTSDNGLNWSAPIQIGILFSPNPGSNLYLFNDRIYLLTSRRKEIYFYQTNLVSTSIWSDRTTLLVSENYVNSPNLIFVDGSYKMIYNEQVDFNWGIYSVENSTLDNNWSNKTQIAAPLFNSDISLTRSIKDNSGKYWIVYESMVPFDEGATQADIMYMNSDNGIMWSESYQFTSFLGDDFKHNVSLIGGDIWVVFQSFRDIEYDRVVWSHVFSQSWSGKLGISEDVLTPPYITNKKIEFIDRSEGLDMRLKVKAFDDDEIQSVSILFNGANVQQLYDDGLHGDDHANDSIYGNTITNISTTNQISVSYYANDLLGNYTIEYFRDYFYDEFQFDNNAYVMKNNRSSMPLDRNGKIGAVYNAYSGFDGISVLYSGGFALSARPAYERWANGVLPSTRVEDYIAGTPSIPSDDSKANLFLLKRTDPAFGNSWQLWKNAVEVGANFYDGNKNGIYDPIDINSNGRWDIDEDRPDLLGDQTVWSIMHDGVEIFDRKYSDIPPLGINIKQSIFTFYELKDVYFIRYEIELDENHLVDPYGHSSFKNLFFSFFLDPDLGDYTDDLIFSDIENQAVGAYNFGEDDIFGDNCPTSFTMLLQGPHTYIPGVTYVDNNANGIFDSGDEALDTAKYFNGELVGIEKVVGAKNLTLSNSSAYFVSAPNYFDPNTSRELGYLMRGYSNSGVKDTPCSYPYGIFNNVNCEDVNPNFIFSGNPLTNTGWIDDLPTDVRFLMNVGPFDLDLEEWDGFTKQLTKVSIIGAIVFARGEDQLNSIELAREKLVEVREFYESNFNYQIVAVENKITQLPDKYSLDQNYPNPFNPTTTISFSIPKSEHVSLKVYDVLGREVGTLVNENKNAGSYSVEFDGSDLVSGIYFYHLQGSEFTETKKLILLK